MSLPPTPLERNHPDDDRQDRRAAASAAIARELSPRGIAALAARAGAGDPEAVGALAWDGLTADDLRALLAGRVVDAPRLAELRSRDRLVLLAATVGQGREVAGRLRFDPATTSIHTDAPDARRTFRALRSAGVHAELLIVGEAVFR